MHDERIHRIQPRANGSQQQTVYLQSGIELYLYSNQTASKQNDKTQKIIITIKIASSFDHLAQWKYSYCHAQFMVQLMRNGATARTQA